MNYTYPDCIGDDGELDYWSEDDSCSLDEKRFTCEEANAALIASENDSMHKTVLSLPYFEECRKKCRWTSDESDDLELDTPKYCYANESMTVAFSARAESCWCDENGPGMDDSKKTMDYDDKYICECEIRNLTAIYSDERFIADVAPEACAEAQANLASDDYSDDLQAECESACAEFEDETCGFLTNGISFALLALLAFL